LSRRKKIQLEANIIVFSFLKAVGIIERDAVSAKFREGVFHCNQFRP
jgi:hypothetical protein